MSATVKSTIIPPVQINLPGHPAHRTAVLFHVFKGLTGASSGSHCGDNTTSQLINKNISQNVDEMEGD